MTISDHHEELHDDDIPVGRVLSRREVLSLLGGGLGGLVLGGCSLSQLVVNMPNNNTTIITPNGTAAAAQVGSSVATVGCVVRPAMTEGPYFVDAMLNRTDVRADTATGAISAGIPLNLIFRVYEVSDSACIPFQNVQIDIWHCDALGVYSGFQDNSANFNTVDQNFLRGYQTTDASGTAQFTTIYPGWYEGRAVHIHFKLRTDAAADTGYEFTSQLFFDDTLSDQVFTLAPYSAKGANRSTRNSNDGIFQNGGDQLTLALSPQGEGYAAVFEIALDTSQPAASGEMGGPGQPPADGQRPPRP